MGLHCKPPQSVSVSSRERGLQRAEEVRWPPSVPAALGICSAPSDHCEPFQSLKHPAKGPQTQAPILKAKEGKGLCWGKKTDSVSLSSHRAEVRTHILGTQPGNLWSKKKKKLPSEKDLRGRTCDLYHPRHCCESLAPIPTL